MSATSQSARFYIDIGSSTIKTYSHSGAALDLIDEKSILFKDGFVADVGVAADKIAALCTHFHDLAALFGLNFDNTRTYATGIWREIPDVQLIRIRERFHDDTTIPFNVISHSDEARYLKQAADLDYNRKKALIINMGGKTTEIVTVNPDGATRTQMLKIGVADLLNQFPNVNDPISAAAIEEMEAFVTSRLVGEEFDTDYDFALFTGELRFEKLSGYPLIPNTMFNDANHPSMVTLDGFIDGTRRIFFDLTMDDLRALMPKNPNWMSGARPGAILPLAIFHRANIKIIVPSDLNLINGVVNEKTETQ
ncbi:MAG: hypothetical protein FWC51_04375 [Proteobacteria bacterium]|nr:hypothetical protein [Pseudomonadota bacterium]